MPISSLTCDRPPHRGHGRVIQPGQKIHPSVWRLDKLGNADLGYSPRARPPASETNFWLQIAESERLGPDGTYSNPWKEADLYDLAEDLVEQYIDSCQSGTMGDAKRSAWLLDLMRIHAKSGVPIPISGNVQKLMTDDLQWTAVARCSVGSPNA